MSGVDVDREVRHRLGVVLHELDRRVLRLKDELTREANRQRAVWLELEELLGERAALREAEAFAVGRERGRAEAVAGAPLESEAVEPREVLRVVGTVGRVLARLAESAILDGEGPAPFRAPSRQATTPYDGSRE